MAPEAAGSSPSFHLMPKVLILEKMAEWTKAADCKSVS